MGLDVMMLQRPFTQEHAMVARTCKVLNVPLWVDYDDLYSAFPNWALPQRQTYCNPHVYENMRQCLDIAEVVTVSTDGLKLVSPKAQVIPNALNTEIWPMRNGPRQQIISWRGSGGHGGDLDEVLPALEKLAAAYPDWPQHYFGVPHFKCLDWGVQHPFSDPFSWMERFCEAAPAVHIVPLNDCPFNRAKSNNAWLEATAAGALVVAPNMPEWKRPGIINYAGPSSFYETVKEVIHLSADVREMMVNQSRDYIHANLTLGKVNRKRIDILKKIVA